MKHTLGLLLDAEKRLQAKERTPPFTRFVVCGIMNGITLNVILGSFQNHKRNCCPQGDSPRCRGRNPVDCDP